MKLQNLIESTLDKSKFPDEISDAVVDSIDHLTSELAECGLKITGYATPSRTSVTSQVTLTTNVFDVRIDVSVNINQEYQCYVSILINPKYLAKGQPYFKDEINSYFNNGLEEADMAKYFNTLAPEINATINKLIDWYMDVSGEYSKVKLFADWRHNRNVCALAGEFSIENNHGQVY